MAKFEARHSHSLMFCYFAQPLKSQKPKPVQVCFASTMSTFQCITSVDWTGLDTLIQLLSTLALIAIWRKKIIRSGRRLSRRCLNEFLYFVHYPIFPDVNQSFLCPKRFKFVLSQDSYRLLILIYTSRPRSAQDWAVFIKDQPGA